MIQCNASNQWGYVFADVFLNVLAQPPSFMVPAQTIVSAEGQSVTLDCSVYSVKPVRIGWMKGSQQLTSGGRQVILPNGNLVIGVRIHSIRILRYFFPVLYIHITRTQCNTVPVYLCNSHCIVL